MNNTTLGPARGRATEEELDATQTVFGRFLLALRSHTTTEQSLTGGTVVWTDESPDQIVLAGMSVLLRSFASQISMEMRTVVQVRAIAEQLNRRLSAGILLIHESPEAAAHAFYTKVILRLRRAHELGYRPGMSLALSAWSALAAGQEDVFIRALPKNHDPATIGDLTEYYAGPSTIFFAQLVKSAREFREQVSSLCEEISEFNRIFRRRDQMVDASDVRFHLGADVLKYLDETQEDLRATPADMQGTLAYLRNTLAVVQTFRLFQVGPHSWPTSSSLVHLDFEWLSTQILLAFSDAGEDAEVLANLEQFQTALVALKRASAQVVRTRTRDWLTTKLGEEQPTPAQWAIIDRKVESRRQRMVGWESAHITDQVLSLVLVHVDERDILLSPQRALEVALGEDIPLVEQARSSWMDMPAWFASVGLAVLWADLTEDEVGGIVEANILPLPVILDGLKLCAPQVQQNVSVQILRGRPGARVLNRLIREGFVELDHDFIRRWIEDIEASILEEQVENLLRYVASSSSKAERFLPTFWRVLGRVSQKAAQDLVDTVATRQRLCTIGVELLTDAELKWPDYDQVREKLGEERFRRFVLGSVACDREAIRTSSEFDPEEETSWEDGFVSGADVYIPLRVLGPKATEAEAKDLLRQIPEAEALAWMGTTTS